MTEKANDGKWALEKLAGAPYDFILCDIKIPGMDGMTLYQELKEGKSPNLDKMIFITGDVISAEIQEFLKSVKKPFLSKPLDLKDVKETIQLVLINP